MIEKNTWFKRLKQGLSQTSSKLNRNISSVFGKRVLDQAAIDDLVDILIMADLGAVTATKLVDEFAKTRFEKEVSDHDIKEFLSHRIEEILTPIAKPFDMDEIKTKTPYVLLVTGVNGSGKTTTIGKLARHWRTAGHMVMLAAGDTFRAAAVEQLKVWGLKTGCPVIRKPEGTDSASVAFEALEQAIDGKYDILIIDTAGRLHNQQHLMDELTKVQRVIQKLLPDAPHSTVQVLDATAGQNAMNQVEIFAKAVNTTGLIITKLDGTAKGGIVVSLADKFHLPIHAIGVGEQADDLRGFQAKDFAHSIIGIDNGEDE